MLQIINLNSHLYKKKQSLHNFIYAPSSHYVFYLSNLVKVNDILFLEVMLPIAATEFLRFGGIAFIVFAVIADIGIVVEAAGPFEFC